MRRLLCALLLLPASLAYAEGSLGPELDASQALNADTQLLVDILDTSETFVWTGAGEVEVFTPDLLPHGTFLPGETITASITGEYLINLSVGQTGVEWDVTVYDEGGEPQLGRLFSYDWNISTGSFAVEASTNATFYALVPGGDPDSTGVIALRLEGLAGNEFSVAANDIGVFGPNAGRSVPTSETFADPLYRVYLNPPERATYTVITPMVSDLVLEGLEDGGECDAFLPGRMSRFLFESNVDGTYQIICDLNGDGEFDVVDPGDFQLLGTAVRGPNFVSWNGLDNEGNPFPEGEHQCIVRVTVGEFHYVGRDIETSFPGLRMYQVTPEGIFLPLRMFWNDSLVQFAAVSMPAPFAYISAATSGPDGVDSGPPESAAVPVGQGAAFDPTQNARAWGDFTGSGKGNDVYLDTYTWLQDEATSPITIRAANDGDSDGDGLLDITERCITTTDPENPDSDGDSISDFEETREGMPGIDSDGDGIIDGLDPDDDDDCIPTIVEVMRDPDGNMDPFDDDADGDGMIDHLDDDDDNDGLIACEEDPNGDGDPTNDDSVGEGTPDYLDPDLDDDGLLDGDDMCLLEPENVNGFQDDDGCPDADEDGDGIADEVDNCPPPAGSSEPPGMGHSTYNPMQEDLNGDGEGDVCTYGGGRLSGGGITSCSASGGGSLAWLALVFLLRRRR